VYRHSVEAEAVHDAAFVHVPYVVTVWHCVAVVTV
jgi:hypothetical protein